MESVTFQATVNDEQVIRPPADVRLPHGTLEVTIRLVSKTTGPVSTAEANEKLRRSRVSTGAATGIDNEGIDADLARAYGNGTDSAAPKARP